jgi:hypothetical protein
MCERGSGRTTCQLAALPDGSWYLVAHRRQAEYCERLLRHIGRDPNSIKFATPDLAEAHVWGRRPTEWDIDHAYFDTVPWPRRSRAIEAMWLASGKPPLSDRVPT